MMTKFERDRDAALAEAVPAMMTALSAAGANVRKLPVRDRISMTLRGRRIEQRDEGSRTVIRVRGV